MVGVTDPRDVKHILSKDGNFENYNKGHVVRGRLSVFRELLGSKGIFVVDHGPGARYRNDNDAWYVSRATRFRYLSLWIRGSNLKYSFAANKVPSKEALGSRVHFQKLYEKFPATVHRLW